MGEAVDESDGARGVGKDGLPVAKGEVGGQDNDDLAHAIIDRVLERGRWLTLDGPSMRIKHLGLDDPTPSEASHQPARSPGTDVIGISGIEVPEFSGTHITGSFLTKTAHVTQFR